MTSGKGRRTWAAALSLGATGITRLGLLIAVTFTIFVGAWAAWHPCESNPVACTALDCDMDGDLDGLPDRIEASDPRRGDPRFADTDEDGLLDGADPCPRESATPIAGRCGAGHRTFAPHDGDFDGLADHLEGIGPLTGTRAGQADSDDDGLLDGVDPCPGRRAGDDPADHPIDDTRCLSGRPLHPPWHVSTSMASKYACWAGNMWAGRVSRSDGMPLMPSVVSSLLQTLVLVAASLLISATAAIALVLLLHAARRRPASHRALRGLLAVSFVPIVLVGYLLGAAVNDIDFQAFRIFDQSLAAVCLGPDRTFSATLLLGRDGCLGDFLTHLALPALVLALGDGNLGYLVRDLARNLAEVDDSAYVGYARLRGVHPARITVWYLLPNVAVLSLIFLRQRIIFLLSGAVVVERMFARDGLGKMLVDALSDNRDLPLLLTAATLFFGVAICVQLAVRVTAMLIERRATL